MDVLDQLQYCIIIEARRAAKFGASRLPRATIPLSGSRYGDHRTLRRAIKFGKLYN